MKIAITGGTGCLGRPLLENLIGKGIDIQLLALPRDPIPDFIKRKVQILTGNLNSLETLKLLTKDCETIFTWLVRFTRFQGQRRKKRTSIE